MSCVNRTEKKMRGYTKTRNHTYIGETERERERKGSMRGKGGFHEVRGERGGRGIKRAEGQEKRRTKNHSTFFLFLQLLSMMVRGKGKKKKENATNGRK